MYYAVSEGIRLGEWESLTEAREAVWDTQFGPINIIYHVDGMPQEAWRGRREVELTGEIMAQYSTPLVFLNQIPTEPFTARIGELKETRNKDGKRLGVYVQSPFTTFSNRDGEQTVHGDATLYWKNDDADGQALLTALGQAGKNLGMDCSIARIGEGQFVVGEPGAAAPPPQAPPVPQGTPPPASATVHHGQPVAAFSNPRVTPVIGEHLYGMCLQAALKAFKANGLEDVTTDAVGHAATAIYISILKGDTVDPTMCPPTEDDLTF